MALNHLKYKDLYERYQNYAWEKCKYNTFAARVTRYWYSKEDAISINNYILGTLWSKLRYKRYNSVVDENGRVCRGCWVYKTWDKFWKNKQQKNWYTSRCLECRNLKKKEYRKANKCAKDKEYRNWRRNLAIGDQIYFQDDIWDVISYKYKKWYTVRSILNWWERIICTWDNHHVKGNHCVRFRKLVHKLEVKTVEELKREEEEKKRVLDL